MIVSPTLRGLSESIRGNAPSVVIPHYFACYSKLKERKRVPISIKSPTYNFAIPAMAIVSLRCILYFIIFFLAHWVIILHHTDSAHLTDSTLTGWKRDSSLHFKRVYSVTESDFESILHRISHSSTTVSAISHFYYGVRPN